MGFILNEIDTVDTISPEDFKEHYFNKRKPLIIKGLSRSWPAYHKWNPDYLKRTVGSQVVPLYNNSKSDPSKPVNTAVAHMPFTEYMDLICSQPTELRIFLFNIFKHAPRLLDDVVLPYHLTGGFLDSLPMMFFGGSNSVTFLHYDIDLSHIFHTHFGGRKHVILFENKWKRRLYCIPNATYALEDYDVSNPDISRFPALEGVVGEEAFLEHGDTMYMPTGYWHWMKYLDGSFSLSLRAWDPSYAIKLSCMYNLTVKGFVDSLLKVALKNHYAQYRIQLAIKRAEKELSLGLPL